VGNAQVSYKFIHTNVGCFFFVTQKLIFFKKIKFLIMTKLVL